MTGMPGARSPGAGPRGARSPGPGQARGRGALPGGPHLAGPGQVLVPLAPPGGAPCPQWLNRLVSASARVDPAWFSRFLPPDEGGRESAVLLLFGPGPDGADSVVLIERAHHMRSHAGQVALPGGAVDADDADVVAAALREAQEEVCLAAAGVEVVGQLPSLYLPPSGFVVTPVLGWWRDPSPVGVGDPAEVAQVIIVPLAHLVEPANRHTVTHPSGFVGPAFDLGDDLLLWGFTGGLVNKALELAGLSRPWDEGRQRPLPERFTGGTRR